MDLDWVKFIHMSTRILDLTWSRQLEVIIIVWHKPTLAKSHWEGKPFWSNNRKGTPKTSAGKFNTGAWLLPTALWSTESYEETASIHHCHGNYTAESSDLSWLIVVEAAGRCCKWTYSLISMGKGSYWGDRNQLITLNHQKKDVCDCNDWHQAPYDNQRGLQDLLMLVR